MRSNRHGTRTHRLLTRCTTPRPCRLLDARGQPGVGGPPSAVPLRGGAAARLPRAGGRLRHHVGSGAGREWRGEGGAGGAAERGAAARLGRSTRSQLPTARCLLPSAAQEAEIFSPPYLSKGPQPEISSAPKSIKARLGRRHGPRSALCMLRACKRSFCHSLLQCHPLSLSLLAAGRRRHHPFLLLEGCGHQGAAPARQLGHSLDRVRRPRPVARHRL